MMLHRLIPSALLFLLFVSLASAQASRESFRVATFNASLNRREAGELLEHSKLGTHPQLRHVAEIIQHVRPDILLLNEFDYDSTQQSVQLFQDNYLGKGQRDGKPIRYRYSFSAEVNTGVPSGLDLNQDDRLGPDDAFGYGRFPGQYGMVVLSRFPIAKDDVRTFQKFLWKDMPGALLPRKEDGSPYYSAAATAKLRLSSKSHWDVPIQIGEQTLHFLVSHPTPPVFDGPEDRNGCRNHDEIRFWADYVRPDKSSYIYDDENVRGGLKKGSRFVIAGDLNADPFDGASRGNAVRQLTEHELVMKVAPTSRGGVQTAKSQAEANLQHQGDPAQDTADFPDRNVGNLRTDYVLPSLGLHVVDQKVFWPERSSSNYKLILVSDHRLVWLDLRFAGERVWP